MTGRTRDYFDRITSGWDRNANDVDLYRRLKALVGRLGIARGGWVLDVGTGTGITCYRRWRFQLGVGFRSTDEQMRKYFSAAGLDAVTIDDAPGRYRL
jgi:hypothetical protein